MKYIVLILTIIFFQNCTSHPEAECEVLLKNKYYSINYRINNPIEAFVLLSSSDIDSNSKFRLVRTSDNIITFIDEDTLAVFDYQLGAKEISLSNSNGSYRIYKRNDSLWFDSNDGSEHHNLTLE